jgi:hypothetical protein
VRIFFDLTKFKIFTVKIKGNCVLVFDDKSHRTEEEIMLSNKKSLSTAIAHDDLIEFRNIEKSKAYVEEKK